MDLANQLARAMQRDAASVARLDGAVIGVVTGNQDPEKLGRVQLMLPTISAQDNTRWAPVMSTGAGNNRGWFFIPEIDDEVVVMFEHGSIDHPVVVGALWNGKDKPADKNDGGNERRVIKSRAGSRIIFDDDKGVLIIEDGGGKGRVTLDAKNKLITLEALSGDVCIQAPQGEVSIVADKVVFKAGTNLEIVSGSGFQVGGDANITIKASASMSIDGPTVDISKGNASSPQAPKASAKDIADPYGS